MTKVTTFGEEEARDDAWTVATAKARLSEVIDRAPTHGPSLLLETGVPQRWWSVLTNGSERPDGLAPWPSFSRPRPCAKELICKSNDLQIARVL